MMCVSLWAGLLKKWWADFIEIWCYDWVYQSEELINFWWGSCLRYGLQITLHFPRHCRMQDFRRFIVISHTVTAWLLRDSAKWLMPTLDRLMSPQHFWRDPADIRIQFQINSAIWIGISDHFWLKFCHWQRFALFEHSRLLETGMSSLAVTSSHTSH